MYSKCCVSVCFQTIFSFIINFDLEGVDIGLPFFGLEVHLVGYPRCEKYVRDFKGRIKLNSIPIRLLA